MSSDRGARLGSTTWEGSLFLVSMILLLSCGCAVPIRTTISPEALRRDVARAEGERDGRAPALRDAVSHADRTVRIAALRALARIQEIGTSSLAIPLLGDRDDEVAKWAAFSLGQIGEAAGEAALIAALRGVSPVPSEVLLALGRSGTATSAREISAMLQDPRADVRGSAAMALGLMVKRLGAGVSSDASLRRVVPLLADRDRAVRFGAAYALFRMAGPVSAVHLIRALGDEDPEIRATAARGLGLSRAAPHAFDSALDDPDWRVRVEVVRALGAIAASTPAEAPQTASRLLAIISRERARFSRGDPIASGIAMHVLLAAVDAALEMKSEGARVLSILEEGISSSVALEAGSDAARLACAVAHALDRNEGVIRRVRACGDASLPAWRRDQLVARLLANQGTDAAVAALTEMSAHSDPRVRVAAVEALGEIEQPSSVAALAALLDASDPYLVSAAADALSRPERARFRPQGLVEKLSRALTRTIGQTDAGFAVLVLDAIAALGRDASGLLPELEKLSRDPRAPIRRRTAKALSAISGRAIAFGRAEADLPFSRPGPIADRMDLVLVTTRGVLSIELFGDLAPDAAGTLIDLARGGFYDGKTFHRVVSDFVAQGGCPRGDGWGGPGYTIEDETSPAAFDRGAVGIATSGRDTGGSQFFIMHARHPHLEGSYAVVGRVVRGMDVVDAIQQDDRILEARVEHGRGRKPASAHQDGRQVGLSVP